MKMAKSEIKSHSATNFLNEYAPVPPQTCHLILRTLAWRTLNLKEFLNLVNPELLRRESEGGEGASINEGGTLRLALNLLIGLGLVVEENDELRLGEGVKFDDLIDNHNDAFRLLMTRFVIADSARAVASDSEPSDLITYAGYLIDSFDSRIQINSWREPSNHVGRIYSDPTLNQERWNSLRRWMVALGWAESINNRFQIDCTGIIDTLVGELLRIEFEKEFTAEEFIVALGDHIPIYSPLIQSWIRGKSGRVENLPGTHTPPPSVQWAMLKLKLNGVLNYRLLDDFRGTYLQMNEGRYTHLTFQRKITDGAD
jgi:hypothetical protein